jgi:hypothetical protein
MNPLERRQAISDALNAFATLSLRDAGLKLLETMGYKSEKTFDLSPNSAETFLGQFDPFASTSTLRLTKDEVTKQASTSFSTSTLT